MDTNNKQKIVELVKDIFTNNSCVVVVDYKGLDAQGMLNLRKALKTKGCNLRVAKNTLVKVALKDIGSGELIDSLKEQTAISYSNDPVALSNVLIKFADENPNVKIKIGSLDSRVISFDIIKDLSKLGSLEEVRAAFIATLKAPASNLVRLMQGSSSKLINLFGSYIASKE